VLMRMVTPPEKAVSDGERIAMIEEKIKEKATKEAEMHATRQEIRVQGLNRRIQHAQGRALQRDVELQAVIDAEAAIIAVEKGEVKPRFRFNKDRLFVLGLRIMDDLRIEGRGTKLDPNKFCLKDYTCVVSAAHRGDTAHFTLNPLTGAIGVELHGSGGLGGNVWYVISMERVGSVTQQMSGYKSVYITEQLKNVMENVME